MRIVLQSKSGVISDGIMVKSPLVVGFMEAEYGIVSVLDRYHRGRYIRENHKFLDDSRGDGFASGMRFLCSLSYGKLSIRFVVIHIGSLCSSDNSSLSRYLVHKL